MKKTGLLISICVMLGASTAQRAYAQDASAQAFKSLEACAAAARIAGAPDATENDKAAGKQTGTAAEAEFRALLKASPASADAHYGLASVISQCRIPYAGMATILSLVDESIREAQAALAIDAHHWGARFILAMDYFHMPAMLGKTKDAITELETLVAQQGDAKDPPNYALPFVHLGEAYEKSGRLDDAARVWRKGLSLFPANTELKKHVAELKTDTPAPAAVLELPAITALEPLRVDVSAQQLDDARSGTALRRLDVYMMPGGTGEMMQALQATPGVTRANDGADMYVRGGNPAETPVFVDGGRIAFPGRWETLNGAVMGVLDASVLRKAYFSAGGFSARYGDALSGVVDVETRGRPEEASWRAGVNFVQAGASIARPLSAKSGAWATASVADTRLVSSMNGQSAVYPDAPKSVQAIGGAVLAPAHGVELRALGIAMTDMATRTVSAGSYRGDFESSGTTLHGALSGSALRRDGRLGLEASVAASQRESDFAIGVLNRDRTDRTVNGRADLEYAGDATRMRGGFELAALDATEQGTVPTTPNIAPGSPFAALDASTSGTSHIGGYAEVEHRPTNALSLVAGVRADRLPGESEVTVDPRFAAGYTYKAWTLRAGAGVYHQGSWRRAYGIPEQGSPSGTPREARHLVAGAEHAGEPSIRLEAYRKTYGSYVAAGNGPAITAGASKGVDMIVRWSQQKKLNGWITYSLLDATVDLEDGRRVRAPFDVTHTVTAVARYTVSDNWEVGSTIRYGTGRPFTPVTGGTAAENGAAAPVYGDTQSERLPSLQRLDARISRYIRGEKSFILVYAEMLNLLDRQNVFSYSYDATWSKRTPVDAFFAHRTIVLGAELSH